MTAQVTDKPLAPWQAVERYQAAQPHLAGKFGATAVFVGTMRDVNQGDKVQSMTLEHYPAMTQKYLDKLCLEATQRWDILDTLVIHRYGRLLPDDPIVLVAVWSGHRDHAFKACRYIIDALKTRAPFWKQEQTSAGSRWVEQESE